MLGKLRLAAVLAVLSVFAWTPYSLAGEGVVFTPLGHATFVMEAGGRTVYVDPVGKAESYAKFPPPDVILITHDHQDHLAPALLKEMRKDKTRIIAPKSSSEGYGEVTVMNNGDSLDLGGMKIEAVPMYNTTPERLNFHPRGKGNGYVVTLSGKRIYIAGDTEDIPEMEALKDIDYAFMPMNLPYTMTEEQAAKAVLEFKPRVVIPYHYRSKGGISSLEKFRELMKGANGIEVRLLTWY